MKLQTSDRGPETVLRPEVPGLGSGVSGLWGLLLGESHLLGVDELGEAGFL